MTGCRCRLLMGTQFARTRRHSSSNNSCTKSLCIVSLCQQGVGKHNKQQPLLPTNLQLAIALCSHVNVNVTSCFPYTANSSVGDSQPLSQSLALPTTQVPLAFCFCEALNGAYLRTCLAGFLPLGSFSMVCNSQWSAIL